MWQIRISGRATLAWFLQERQLPWTRRLVDIPPVKSSPYKHAKHRPCAGTVQPPPPPQTPFHLPRGWYRSLVKSPIRKRTLQEFFLLPINGPHGVISQMTQLLIAVRTSDPNITFAPFANNKKPNEHSQRWTFRRKFRVPWKRQAENSSEGLEGTYQTIRCHNLELHNVNQKPSFNRVNLSV
jgi:hypothetical protein